MLCIILYTKISLDHIVSVGRFQPFSQAILTNFRHFIIAIAPVCASYVVTLLLYRLPQPQVLLVLYPGSFCPS